ncbi:MAG: hypothetical protein ACRD63_09055 [Pyrinomonadaceae bacterium]
MASNIASEVAAKVASLPLEKQNEVLRLVESLVETTARDKASQVQRRRLLGSLEHLNITLSDDDIREARREM